MVDYYHCVVKKCGLPGAYFRSKPSECYRVKFADCLFSDTAKRSDHSFSASFWFLCKEGCWKDQGGVYFDNCIVNDEIDRPFLSFFTQDETIGIRDISGRIVVNNPHGARMDLGDKAHSISLEVEECRTLAPYAEIRSPSYLGKFKPGSKVSVHVLAYDPDIGEQNGDGIEKVELRVSRGSSTLCMVEASEAPYQFQVDTRSYEQGIYIIWAKAISKDGPEAIEVDAIPISVQDI